MTRRPLQLLRPAVLVAVLIVTATQAGFDGAFNRLPAAPDSSSATVWSLGFSVGAQRRFRDPSPQSYAFFFNPSVGYVISEEWNASFSMPITRRWFDTIDGVSQRNPTWEPTGVVE